ncbi:MAG: 50S ribosomal protein L21 [Alphaproteobacteria bacterium RIFCSPHIGHO2_01_FULL_41_14]|nr:MAG: 50S ribosomal protein L21 [Alphaproteobacteria bacterium GWB1_45_5]OFW76818.1 MAG: 50S ribosomal protein L21 [Alphaproteobacteria bacterium GWA1_45_9]OFW90122.1 MAG: 50S ribosomal protein L21 [Alphaproteobacteria bacterium RIFCSPHIGHO2_01_FULL_41_14]HCI48430.1 50S ribosomal protein L21 [Holosporales bacterium]
MFAIIRTGGKQYKVSKDAKIVVEKLESAVGSQIIITDVLMVGTDTSTVMGNPVLEGAQVITTVEKHTRDDKVIVFKKKRRHNYRRKKGHKQHKTMLRIVDILHGGKVLAAAEKPAVVKEAKAKVEGAVKKAPAEKAKQAPAAKKKD